MKSNQVEKKLIQVDGEELEGLVSLDEYGFDDDAVEVPGRDKIVPVRTGVRKIPGIPGVFKVTRGSRTLKYLQDWYLKHEYHDVTIIRTDGSGNEFSRELWPNVEINKLHAPAYTAESPTYAQALVNFLPEDILPIDPA